jgi:hypothetical protein
MARHIGQTFLQHAIYGGCKRLGQLKVLGHDRQLAPNAMAPLKRLDKPSARRYKAEIVEHGGAQIGGEPPCRTDHVIHGLFH